MGLVADHVTKFKRALYACKGLSRVTDNSGRTFTLFTAQFGVAGIFHEIEETHPKQSSQRAVYSIQIAQSNGVRNQVSDGDALAMHRN